jgi:hypothetical protein
VHDRAEHLVEHAQLRGGRRRETAEVGMKKIFRSQKRSPGCALVKDARGKRRASSGRKVWRCLGHGLGDAGLLRALPPSLAVAHSRIPAIPFAQGDGGVGPVVGDSELRLSPRQLHGRRGCGAAQGSSGADGGTRRPARK